eukprot:TRINITY_DN2168_c0_g1_i1.p1 TRINITY_DN2168_c0_g1~~TRINITY_DN2168_c0_g1_i1.p1  ORF type:complete len:455 (+),score=161.14 TRINITY_DN2168_c0_g1_i1:679-2043(+)
MSDLQPGSPGSPPPPTEDQDEGNMDMNAEEGEHPTGDNASNNEDKSSNDNIMNSLFNADDGLDDNPAEDGQGRKRKDREDDSAANAEEGEEPPRKRLRKSTDSMQVDESMGEAYEEGNEEVAPTEGDDNPAEEAGGDYEEGAGDNYEQLKEEYEREQTYLTEEEKFEKEFKEKVMPKNKSRRRKASAKLSELSTEARLELDIQVNDFVERMREAYKKDQEAHQNKQPAINKLKMLPEVIQTLQKQNSREGYFEGGFLKCLKQWLQPLPDGTLPNLKIREGILKNLIKIDISDDQLEKSGIGKIMVILQKHKGETHDNKKICNQLIMNWSRTIFDIKDEKFHRPPPEMSPRTPSRRNSLGGSGGTPRISRTASMDALDSALSQGSPQTTTKTYFPEKARMDYTQRPTSYWKEPEKPSKGDKNNKQQKLKDKLATLKTPKGKEKTRALQMGVNKPN